MNRNSTRRRKQALKNYNKGIKTSTFEIPMTVSGSTDLKTRIQTITIGGGIKKNKDKQKKYEGGGMTVMEQTKMFHGPSYKENK